MQGSEGKKFVQFTEFRKKVNDAQTRRHRSVI
jgi:hypothetical protein